MALVFPAFKRPDAFPNVLMVLTVSSNEFLSPSSVVISVPSAYCEFFYSVPPIKIPFICLFCLIIMASISPHKINKYGDIGFPCLYPL